MRQSDLFWRFSFLACSEEFVALTWFLQYSREFSVKIIIGYFISENTPGSRRGVAVWWQGVSVGSRGAEVRWGSAAGSDSHISNVNFSGIVMIYLTLRCEFY